MKTVTIPTCANPFVVIVNGIKYTYPAGATVSVPDDVAAVIEQHDEAHNNPAPAPVVPPFVPSEGGGGGGGGATPKIIDLNDARYGSGLGDIIFSRVGQSGKYTHEINDSDAIELFRNLFTDFDTLQPIILRVRTSDNTMAVETTAFYKSYMNGTLAQVSVYTVTSLMGNIFTFKVALEDGDPCRMHILCSVE